MNAKESLQQNEFNGMRTGFEMEKISGRNPKLGITMYQSKETLIPGLPGTEVGIGIDPGADWGFTVFLFGFRVTSFHGKLPGTQNPAVEMYDAMMDMFKRFSNNLCTFHVVIEGASYGDKFGQVSLAEKRAGAYLAAYHMDYECTVVPPASIRKVVLGSAKVTGKDIYPNIDQNAADSIPAALLAWSYAIQDTKR